MNRKNLTAAVLAGLAGVAGIAGTAQAVNINPDGLGQVLIYPYYTANGGNQTLLSVVNTTEQAKAVKVRFLEGFNSREVLDFNLYMSHHDVWVAGITDLTAFPDLGHDEDFLPGLMIPDNSCTVPYLYEMNQIEIGGKMYGTQEFLDIAYTDYSEDFGAAYDFSDGGPTGIGRAAEGHFEIIEMGTIYNDTPIGEALTHDPDTGMPEDCQLLVDAWTRDLDTPDDSGQWIRDIIGYCEGTGDDEVCYDATSDLKGPGVGTFNISRNSGGLFGGAAVVNAMAGSMFSYDAIAVQGFDKFEDGLGLNYEPGTIYPSLNSGDQNVAYLFFGPPTNEPWSGEYIGVDENYNSDDCDSLSNQGCYDVSVDAISALFMKSNIVNEYYVVDALKAATEWIISFPTKNFYADPGRILVEELLYIPRNSDGSLKLITASGGSGDDAWEIENLFEYEPAGWDCPPVYDPLVDEPTSSDIVGYGTACDVLVRPPFTKYFAQTQEITDDIAGDFIAPDCEVVYLKTWNREEGTFSSTPDDPSGTRPPVVSPSLPQCTPPFDAECTPVVDEVPFQLCNEVNVVRFGDRDIFSTPTFDQAPLAGLNNTLLITVPAEENPYDEGWGRIRFDEDSERIDEEGLVGLPVTGFAAQRYSNEYLTDDMGERVKSTYGGLFKHKGLVTRILND